MTASPLLVTSEARWFDKVDRDGPTPQHAPWLGPCWTWTGALSGTGYGEFRDDDGRLVGAHRWIAERVAGRDLGPDEHVDHLCHEPDTCSLTVDDPHRRCCNPAHLTVTSPQRNNARSSSPSARNARKDVCDWGHLFDEANTYVHPKRGTRDCRACRKRRRQEHRARQQEAARPPAEVVDLAARRAARG